MAMRPKGRVGDRYNDYIDKRTWWIETTETAEDAKQTKREVAKLDKTMNWASRSPQRNSAGSTAGQPGSKFINKLYQQGR
jgi:hypothetical protein